MSLSTMKEILPQSGVGFLLRAGQKLKVLDPMGSQVADLFCLSRIYTGEWFSAARTIDYAGSLLLTTGNILYSNMSNPMAKIIEDTCGRHDLLIPPCCLKEFQTLAGNTQHHPNCDENLASSLKKYGVPANRIATSFNIFMNVSFEKGDLRIHPPASRPGDHIVLEALMDLVVALTACAHEETNGGECKPIRYEILE